MTNTNSDHWGPENISPYPLSPKLRTKRSTKCFNFRNYFYDSDTNTFLKKTSITHLILGFVSIGVYRTVRKGMLDLSIPALLACTEI